MDRSKVNNPQIRARKRSVASILARERGRSDRHRRAFPPDFTHGQVAVAELYDVLGALFAERVLFAVDDGTVRTAAYFDDYFLVVEQRSRDRDDDWDRWWRALVEQRSSLVVLELDAKKFDDAAICIDIDRQRLGELEKQQLGVIRGAMTGGSSLEKRCCRGEIDVLSLVTLTSSLSETAMAPSHPS